jgi:hypothetical protein
MHGARDTCEKRSAYMVCVWERPLVRSWLRWKVDMKWIIKGCPNKSARFNFVIKRTIYSKSADVFISV